MNVFVAAGFNPSEAEHDTVVTPKTNAEPLAGVQFTGTMPFTTSKADAAYVTTAPVFDVPVHILHVTDASGAGVMSHPRHVLVAERHAKASVIESYVSLADVSYFTNAVVEVSVDDGATLQLLRIQRESPTAFHVGTVEARQGRDSHFMAFTFQTGAALSRSNVFTVLAGEGCGTTLNGLYMLGGAQHGDHQTRVEHVAPNCFSREAYKGLLDDSSHGVFNGKVYVHPEAQKTDGKQSSHALLLTETAEFDAKPELEIYADDVACGHGATSGDLNHDHVFYLKSRGIPEAEAKALLIAAFVGEAFDTVHHDGIRAALEAAILGLLDHRAAGATICPSEAARSFLTRQLLPSKQLTCKPWAWIH